MLPTPLATTRRLLLPVLVVLAIPFKAATKDLPPRPSMSCLDADGEKYLQGLLDRVHQLELQLDAELEARLTERAEAERNMQGVADELAHQAAAALDPPKPPTRVEAFDPEQARKELASLKAALDEETAARRRAEAEATAASKTATTFARALEELEHRLAAAEKRVAPAGAASEESDAATAAATNPVVPPAFEPSPQAQAAEPAPTARPMALSEGERPAPQPPALTETPALPTARDAQSTAIANATAAEPAAASPPTVPAPVVAPAPPTASESERAAAQLAALTGKRPQPVARDVTSATPQIVAAPEPTIASPDPASAPVTASAPSASESERAAAQLAALQGRVVLPAAKPAPSPATGDPAEGTAVAATQPRAANTRCDEPLETARIASGDKVSIQVEHLEEVSRTVQVASDGQVNLPLLGRVPVAGRNQHELVANLEQRLKLYLQAPRVEVALQRDCGRSW